MAVPDFLSGYAKVSANGERVLYGALSTDGAPTGWLRVAFREPGRKSFFSTAEVLPEENATLNIEFAAGKAPAPPVAEFVDDLFRKADLPFLLSELRSARLTYLDRPYDIRWLIGAERDIARQEVFGDAD